MENMNRNSAYQPSRDDEQYADFLRRHGAHGPVIDAKPKQGFQGGPVSRFFHMMFALFILGLFLPFFILFGGIALLATWDVFFS